MKTPTDMISADADAGGGPVVTGANRRTLDQVFHNPLSHHVAWDDVVALARHIGHVEERSNDNFVFKVGREVLEMRKPHTHHLTAPEVMGLRKFLSASGKSPG